MNMKDFDELRKEYNHAEFVFNLACRSLYNSIAHKDSALVVSLAVKDCDKARLAMECARKDMFECFNREATIATLEA